MRRSQRLQCSLCVRSAAQFLKCAAEEPSRRTLFCEHTLEYLLMNERKGLLRRLKRLWVGHRTLLVGEGSARSIHPALGVAGGKDAKGWQCSLSLHLEKLQRGKRKRMWMCVCGSFLVMTLSRRATGFAAAMGLRSPRLLIRHNWDFQNFWRASSSPSPARVVLVKTLAKKFNRHCGGKLVA